MKKSIRYQIYVLVSTVVIAISVQSCGGGGRALSGAADALDLTGANSYTDQPDYPVSTTLYKIESCESTPVCFSPDNESNVSVVGGHRIKSCNWNCAEEYEGVSNIAVDIGFVKEKQMVDPTTGIVVRHSCWVVGTGTVSEECR